MWCFSPWCCRLQNNNEYLDEDTRSVEKRNETPSFRWPSPLRIVVCAFDAIRRNDCLPFLSSIFLGNKYDRSFFLFFFPSALFLALPSENAEKHLPCFCTVSILSFFLVRRRWWRMSIFVLLRSSLSNRRMKSASIGSRQISADISKLPLTFALMQIASTTSFSNKSDWFTLPPLDAHIHLVVFYWPPSQGAQYES